MTAPKRRRHLKQRDVALIALGTCVLVSVGFHFIGFTPIVAHTAELQTQLGALDTQVTKSEAARRGLPGLRTAVAELERDNAAFLRAVPAQADLAPLMIELETTVRRSGAALGTVTQGGAEGADTLPAGVRATGLGIDLEGSFDATFAALDRIERMNRYLTVSALNMSPGDPGRVRTHIDLNAYTFSIGEAARAKAEVSAPAPAPATPSSETP